MFWAFTQAPAWQSLCTTDIVMVGLWCFMEG